MNRHEINNLICALSLDLDSPEPTVMPRSAKMLVAGLRHENLAEVQHAATEVERLLACERASEAGEEILLGLAGDLGLMLCDAPTDDTNYLDDWEDMNELAASFDVDAREIRRWVFGTLYAGSMPF